MKTQHQIRVLEKSYQLWFDFCLYIIWIKDEAVKAHFYKQSMLPYLFRKYVYDFYCVSRLTTPAIDIIIRRMRIDEQPKQTR